MAFPLVIAWIVDIALWAGHAWLAATVLFVLLGSFYLVSLRADPWRHCRKCGGSDTHSRTGRAYPGAFSSGCWRPWCHRGRTIRWGVLLLTPGRARRLKAERMSMGGR
jgi:hypothetical protein